MHNRWPGFIGKRIPNPGGSQGSPEAGPRRVLIGAWTIAWVVAVLCSGLSETGSGEYFLWALGVLPVLLFIGLSILGLLTKRVAYGYVALWVGGCIWLIWASLRLLG